MYFDFRAFGRFAAALLLVAILVFNKSIEDFVIWNAIAMPATLVAYTPGMHFLYFAESPHDTRPGVLSRVNLEFAAWACLWGGGRSYCPY